MARAGRSSAEEPGPRVGELVIVPYPEARERLGLGPEVGLAIDDRRSVVQVRFPLSDRTLWIPREHLEAVAPSRLPAHPLLRRVHGLAMALAAERIEFGDDDEQEPDVVFVSFPGAPLAALERLAAGLGTDAVSVRVEPGSMHRVRLRVRFAAHVAQPPPEQALEREAGPA